MPREHRIRVLMLLGPLPSSPGGGERFAVGLAAHLPADRYDVTFCTSRPAHDGELLAQLREAGVKHLALARRTRLDLATWVRFTALLRRQRFDVVHAHMFGANVWGTLCGRLAQRPLVVAHEHSWSFEGRPLRRFVDRELIGRFADLFVAVSSRDRDQMIAVEGVPAEKIVVMPNAYVPRPPPGGIGDLRSELGLGPSVPLVGTAAVMRTPKALHVLIEAFSRARVAFPEAQLVLAGDGELRASLEQQARELGIAEQTHFLGYRDDIVTVLEALDVAVMSSDNEGSPLFALECMAHATPLVSTDVGSIRDVLEDGESVVLVPRRDPVALGAAIAELLGDPDRRARVGAAAAARLGAFEMPVVAARFGELYENALARQSSGRLRAAA